MGPAQGAVADDPAAQQRRRLDVAHRAGHPHRDARLDRHELGKPAVAVPAGELGLGAEVLASRAAEAAVPARTSQPVRPDPVPDGQPGNVRADLDDASDRLVAERDRQASGSQITARDLQVGAADPACADAHDELARCGCGLGNLVGAQAIRGERTRLVESHCSHMNTLA